VKLCIRKDVIGTSQHLIVDIAESISYSWCSLSPNNIWTVGAAIDEYVLSIEAAAKITGQVIPHIAAEKHIEAFKALGSEDLSSIPWRLVLGQNLFDSGLNCIIQAAQNVICGLDRTNYTKTYTDARGFLLSLSRATTSKDKINRYVNETSSGPSVISSLQSFLPDNNMLSRKVLYDQSATVTGRLTVQSGPAILTLPQKYRNVIQSSFKRGKIIQIDFVSIEPRVLSLVLGGSPPADIYTHINQNLFDDRMTRSQVKLAVLAAMYGISHKKLSEMIPTENSRAVIRAVRNFFGLGRLENELTLAATSGKLTNYFGRPLASDVSRKSILISHYIQSSASDLALTGFSKLVNVLDYNNVSFKPIFVIHDALIIDVDTTCLDKIESICAEGYKHDLGNFPLSVTTITSGNT